MLAGIIFYTIYFIVAAFTTSVTRVIFEAHISSFPKTRDLGLEWVSWPLGVLAGIVWPITIPVAIIIAGVIK